MMGAFVQKNRTIYLLKMAVAWSESVAPGLTCNRGWWPLSGARQQSWKPAVSLRQTGRWRPVHSPRSSWSAADTAPATWNPAAGTPARWCWSARHTPRPSFVPSQLCVYRWEFGRGSVLSRSLNVVLCRAFDSKVLSYRHFSDPSHAPLSARLLALPPTTLSASTYYH